MVNGNGLTDIEIVSCIVTFPFRALGFKVISQRANSTSVITSFEDNKRIIVYDSDPSETYTQIYVNGDIMEERTFLMQINKIFGNSRPKTQEEVDELISGSPHAGNSYDNIVTHWLIHQRLPYRLEELVPKSGPLREFWTTVLKPALDNYIYHSSSALKFSQKELDIILYDILKPEIAGQLLFPQTLRSTGNNEELIEEKIKAEKKAKAERKEKREKIREEKARRTELKKQKQLNKGTEELRKPKAKVNDGITDKYPIYNPPPLSGFGSD